ncbi:response regulator transcription factor [Hoyosella sp. YIM 151337]|uniref:response regulator transcription factor n=1 Tax=Hoyosella sp. YIM 151337 TaxID=2992742 RepID=UPI002236A96C|nr:response regulator transcription factor [Hoyosella sp. YIM 151337]MCW4355313.1 response regulator transcription factor [Hoyosella sp. YIM 151337]
MDLHVANAGAVDSSARVRPAILVIDDDERVVDDLVEGLNSFGFDVHVCAEPAEALLLVGRIAPDVVIAAKVGGRIDTLDFLSIVRASEPDLPIFAGADANSGDFAARAAGHANIVIPRPYRVRELPALLQSYVRAGGAWQSRPHAIDLGRLRVDAVTPQMWLDGECMRLPPREFALLRYFADREGAVISRQELIDAAWQGSGTHSNTLTVHIARLRRRLGDDEANPQWIRAIRGFGYQFRVPQ